MPASPQIEPSRRVPLRRAPAPPPLRLRFWERFALLALRRPLAFMVVAIAAFAIAAPGAVHLYRDLRTDLRELLPRGAPAAVALEELERRVGGLAQLAVLIHSDDLKAGERFVDALEAKLTALPPSMVRQVKARVNEEKRFLLEHGALYLDAPDLERFRGALRRAKAAKNPLAVDLSDEQNDPAVDPGLEAALAKADRAYADVDRYTDGYLVGEGGKTFVVLVSPPSVALSLHSNQQLLAAVQGAVNELKPKSFDPSIHVGYGGEVTQVIEAQAALVHDLELSSVLVLLAVSLALFFYYRTLWSIPLLVVPLFTGIVVTFSLSRLAIHYLNPSTAFLGSIIIGNGINAGIILLARYLEDRRLGIPMEKALPDSLSVTWLPTLVASLAAAASYGSLCATSFRGFNQFGLMGVIGMTLCWIASYVLMPPLIVLLERAHPRGLVISEGKAPVGRLSARFAPLPAKYARSIVYVSVALALLSTLGIARFVREPFEYDFTKLGSRRGEKNGAEYWNHHLDEVLKVNQSPAVVLTDSPQEAKKVADALDREREREGPASTIDSVQSLQKLVPEDQGHKLGLLRSIFAMLTPNVVSSLPEKLKPAVRRMLLYTVLRPVTLDDVPQQLRQIFRERDGSSGKLVLVYTSPAADARAGKAQLAHARRIREVALQAVPTARIAGSVILTSDILSSITGDGALAAVMSFLAVSVFTLLLLRSMRDAGWVLTSLCLGVVWLGGAVAALGLRFNFVNFVVLPITFGIGVDYAVNFYKRYTVSRSVEEALAGAGGAVALCSTTTIIGYSALLIADNRAIFSFGLMAVLGEVACLTAALVTLPALLAWRR